MQWNGQRNGLIVPVTAALEDADAQGIRGTVQLQPQCGGRRRRRGRLGPEQEGRGAPAFRRQLQAPEGGEADIPGPGQHDALRHAAQGLLAGPQRFAAAAAADQQQAFQAQAVTMQGRGVGDPRRIDEEQPAALPAGRGQGGEQQAELAQPRPGGDQLGDRAPRPAAARKMAVQPRMAGGQNRLR